MKRRFSEIVEITGTACQEFEDSKKYVSTGSVHHDTVCDNEVKVIDFKNRPSRANLKVDTGDILFAKMQGTRKTLLIDKDLSDNIYSTGFYSVKPKKDLITEKCLYYLIDSKLFLKEKDKNCSGATQKAINNYGLRRIELTIPKYSDQLKIESQLELLSNAIRSKEKQIQLLDSLIKARFVEMFSYDNYTKVNLANLVVGKVTAARKDFNREDVIKYIDISSIDNKRNIITGYSEYILSEAPSRAQQHVIKGDIIISTVRPNLRNVAMITDDNNNIVASSGFCVLRANEKSVPAYLMAIACSDSFTNTMLRAVTGANYPAIKDSDVLNYLVPLPPIDLQNQFSAFVSQVDKSKFAVQKSLEKTQQLFDSLMQEYFG